jgi:hypothetical protein
LPASDGGQITARPGSAWPGVARLGEARHGSTKHLREGLCRYCPQMGRIAARTCAAWHGLARPGKAWVFGAPQRRTPEILPPNGANYAALLGGARLGRAWHGYARETSVGVKSSRGHCPKWGKLRGWAWLCKARRCLARLGEARATQNTSKKDSGRHCHKFEEGR